MNSSPRPVRRFSRWKTRKRTFVLGDTAFAAGQAVGKDSSNNNAKSDDLKLKEGETSLKNHLSLDKNDSRTPEEKTNLSVGSGPQDANASPSTCSIMRTRKQHSQNETKTADHSLSTVNKIKQNSPRAGTKNVTDSTCKDQNVSSEKENDGSLVDHNDKNKLDRSQDENVVGVSENVQLEGHGAEDHGKSSNNSKMLIESRANILNDSVPSERICDVSNKSIKIVDTECDRNSQLNRIIKSNEINEDTSSHKNTVIKDNSAEENSVSSNSGDKENLNESLRGSDEKKATGQSLKSFSFSENSEEDHVGHEKMVEDQDQSAIRDTVRATTVTDNFQDSANQSKLVTSGQNSDESEPSLQNRSLRNRSSLVKCGATQYPIEFLSNKQVKSLSGKAKKILMNRSGGKSPSPNSVLVPSKSTQASSGVSVNEKNRNSYSDSMRRKHCPPEPLARKDSSIVEDQQVNNLSEMSLHESFPQEQVFDLSNKSIKIVDTKCDRNSELSHINNSKEINGNASSLKSSSKRKILVRRKDDSGGESSVSSNSRGKEILNESPEGSNEKKVSRQSSKSRSFSANSDENHDQHEKSAMKDTVKSKTAKNVLQDSANLSKMSSSGQNLNESETGLQNRSLRNRSSLVKCGATQYPIKFLSNKQVKSLSEKAKKILMNRNQAKSPSPRVPSKSALQLQSPGVNENNLNSCVDSQGGKESPTEPHAKKAGTVQDQSVEKSKKRKVRAMRGKVAARKRYSLPKRYEKEKSLPLESILEAPSELADISSSLVMTDSRLIETVRKQSKVISKRDSHTSSETTNALPDAIVTPVIVKKNSTTSLSAGTQMSQLNDTVCGIYKVGRKRKLFSDSGTDAALSLADELTDTTVNLRHPDGSEESTSSSRKRSRTSSKMSPKKAAKKHNKKNKQTGIQHREISRKYVMDADQSIRSRLKKVKNTDENGTRLIFGDFISDYRRLIDRLRQ